MPTTISVSPAVPDKLVVNGVDLVNQEELSASQQRELQRYIDANAHLLGFMDKEKEQEEQENRFAGAGGKLTMNGTGISSSMPSMGGKYESQSLRRAPPTAAVGGAHDDFSGSTYGRPPSTTQSLNRMATGTPLSEYGTGKRKGVSWSDVAAPTGRMRSHSPPQNFYRNSGEFSDSIGTLDDSSRDYRRAKIARDQSPQYSTIDRQRTPYDQDSAYWSPSPWGGASLDRKESEKGQKWKGFAKQDLPTYSALERSQDDFNPYQTHAHREEVIGLRKSQERDEAIKFYGYGDHRVSGLELKPKHWEGGEAVTDPNIMNKSLKPRRFYYSPIGDGVVNADGVEMKRPPPDLTPRRYVYHQRYVEQEPGQGGLRVTEDTWHTGGCDFGDGAGAGSGPGLQSDDGGRGIGDRISSVQQPLVQDRAKRDKSPVAIGDFASPTGKYPSKFPVDDGSAGLVKDDGLGAGGPPADSGPPREGWTITYIANPRECINVYGSTTLTNIFDLEDHTPKTITTVKETFSPAPRDMQPLEEQEQH